MMQVIVQVARAAESVGSGCASRRARKKFKYAQRQDQGGNCGLGCEVYCGPALVGLVLS
jgi:hypothetical protein